MTQLSSVVGQVAVGIVAHFEKYGYSCGIQVGNIVLSFGEIFHNKKRALKTKKNVSKQFKSKEGADAYASMMTVIMTARKRKENVLKMMEGILA